MSHQRIVGVDFLVLAWVVLCVWLGIAVGSRINDLQALGDGLIQAGDSVSGVGDWIANLEDIPLIGGGFGAIADRVDQLGQGAAAQGEAGKEAVFRAALGTGLLLSLLPTLPILAVWVPLRIRLERDRASLKAALRANEPGVWEFLALQAADDMSFRQLRAISDDPWEDLRQGRFRELAQAEIDRLALHEAVRQGDDATAEVPAPEPPASEE
jgi:hypothetical protein